MYKIKDKIDITVDLIKVFKCPATDSFKKHSAVLMVDGKGNEFTWNTLTDKYPEIGTYRLKATIADNNVTTHDFELKAYHVSNCKFSKSVE